VYLCIFPAGGTFHDQVLCLASNQVDFDLQESILGRVCTTFTPSSHSENKNTLGVVVVDHTRAHSPMLLPAWQVGRLAVWAALSVGLSLYNKWLMGRLAFNFPVTLSFAHMAGAALVLNAYTWYRRATQAGPRGHRWVATSGDPQELLEACRPGQAGSGGGVKPSFSLSVQAGKSALPDTADDGRPPAGGWAQEQAWWMRRHGRFLIPVAAMFAASVSLRNSAFAGLPLPVMQLLGACGPLGAYALSAAVGLATLTLPGLASITACVIGVFIAISGRLIPFSHLALARHAAGVGLEVCRGVLLQLLIRKIEAPLRNGSGGAAAREVGTAWPAALGAPSKINRPAPVSALPSALAPTASCHSGRTPHEVVPLSTALLAVYSPLCAAVLAIPAAACEARPALADSAGRPPWFWAAVAGNIAVALAYNLASISCLQHAGVMSLSLTGFAKDWGLVVLSTVVFGREVTSRFVVGMVIVTAAVVTYSQCRRV